MVLMGMHMCTCHSPQKSFSFRRILISPSNTYTHGLLSPIVITLHTDAHDTRAMLNVGWCIREHTHLSLYKSFHFARVYAIIEHTAIIIRKSQGCDSPAELPAIVEHRSNRVHTFADRTERSDCHVKMALGSLFGAIVLLRLYCLCGL